MTFSELTGLDTCPTCRIIFADGQITKQTPSKFNSFSINNKEAFKKRTIVILNSTGGNLEGGLELGKKIQSLGFDTHIAKVARNTSASSNLSPGICASSCTYAYLAGYERSITPESKFGIHQISTAADTKLELSDAMRLTQNIIARISKYLESIGAKQDILTLATQTDFNDINWLNHAQLTDLQIINSGDFSGQKNWARSNTSLGVAWTNRSVLDDGSIELLILQCPSLKLKQKGYTNLIITNSTTLSNKTHPNYNGYSRVRISVNFDNKELFSFHKDLFYSEGSIGSFEINLPLNTLRESVVEKKDIQLNINYGDQFPKFISERQHSIPRAGLIEALDSIEKHCW